MSHFRIAEGHFACASCEEPISADETSEANGVAGVRWGSSTFHPGCAQALGRSLIEDAREAVTLPYIRCKFCGKSHKQVEKMIAGPSVYICSECIDLCNEIIEEEREERQAKLVTRPLRTNEPAESL